ncbi:MAG TPA: NAD-dependent epimerase/dehydratase family protein [Nannocystis exedens]|nr:NAD-dependent epimerase/dehydratase family protein [Nannocystis exedens]
MSTILITGSHGLVGSALRRLLGAAGHRLVSLDLRAPIGLGRGDVRDRRAVHEAVGGCDGIIHLAAVSRVIWAEQDPDLCRETNVGGLHNVVAAALEARRRPWLIFASSREVYGEPNKLPVREDAGLRPINIYGETKIAGESRVQEARNAGLTTAILRLSNVYGSIDDHADRVIPAFAAQAIAGQALRVDGAEHTFDFTHIDDTARGFAAVIDAFAAGEQELPPIHLLTGTPTTLGELANLAVELSGSTSKINLGPPRNYDVESFYGDPRRARELLGWQAKVDIRTGMAGLIAAFRASEGGRSK